MKRGQLRWLPSLFLVAALLFACYSGYRAYESSQMHQEGNADQIRSERESDNRKLLRGDSLSSSSYQEINDKLNIITESLSHPCPTATAAIVPTLTVNPRLFHVLTTCQGFSNHWQARVHYYWYVKQRTVCQAQGGCDMGGFTRILHSGTADDLMDEIPTVVVNPLPKSIMKDSSYIVINRPYAFQEWVQTVSIPEKYVIMAEADHLWMRPLPNLMNGEAPGAGGSQYACRDMELN